MWLSNSFKFPYPVLSPTSDDYSNGNLITNFTVGEVIQTGQVEISYEIEVSESSICNFVKDDSATLGVFIICPVTYYSKLEEIKLGKGVITIDPGQLRGRVEIRTVIFAKDSGTVVSKYGIHEEFGGNDWVYDEHQFLAIGDLYVANVGLEKLAPMESIFDIAQDVEIPIGESRVQLEDERVSIVVNPETYRKVHDVRNSPMGKTVLLNSLYLPVIMSMLDSLKQGSGHLEDFRWFKVFTAKCDVLGVDTENGDIFTSAQTLLKLPLKRLIDLKEFKS